MVDLLSIAALGSQDSGRPGTSNRKHSIEQGHLRIMLDNPLTMNPPYHEIFTHIRTEVVTSTVI